MNLYPDVPARRAQTMIRDGVVLTLVVFCAILGSLVFLAVNSLAVFGEGTEVAGEALSSGLDDAGRALGDIPAVGDNAEDALTDAGDASGGRLAESGRDFQDKVWRTALLLALVSGGLPGSVILLLWLRRRRREVRRLAAARQLFSDGTSEERKRLLALRAVSSLPMHELLRVSDDPLGDVLAGRTEPMLDALAAHEGVRRRT